MACLCEQSYTCGIYKQDESEYTSMAPLSIQKFALDNEDLFLNSSKLLIDLLQFCASCCWIWTIHYQCFLPQQEIASHFFFYHIFFSPYPHCLINKSLPNHLISVMHTSIQKLYICFMTQYYIPMLTHVWPSVFLKIDNSIC